MINQEDLERAIKYGIEWLEDEYLDARDRAFIEIALEALEQMPVITTTGGEEVIYYPQVKGVTPTVVDAGKQEPCDTCGYEEGSIYCKEHCPHEAKIEQEPCEDAISRQAVCKIIDDIRDCVSVNGYWAFLERLKKLPSVNPTKTGHWIAHSDGIWIKYYECSRCGKIHNTQSDYCEKCGAKMFEPQERSSKE